MVGSTARFAHLQRRARVISVVAMGDLDLEAFTRVVMCHSAKTGDVLATGDARVRTRSSLIAGTR